MAAIAPISYSGYAANLPTTPQALSAGTTPTTTGDAPAVNVSVNQPSPILNFTAQSGDQYRIATLFQGTAPSGVDPSQLTYNVAIRGGGQLLLNGQPVGTQTSFTDLQFNQLSFVAGDTSSDIAVSAVTPGGVSSNPVQVTANTGSERSTNALAALYGGDPYANLAFTANLLSQSVPAAQQPKVNTAGNFTALNGDQYRLANLFSATGPNGQAITQYSVAVRGGGTLYLNGVAVDPNAQTTFTPAQFEQLSFGAGTSASDIIVAAQAGSVSSPAISINAAVGTDPVDRTINAAGALYNGDSYQFIGFVAQLTQSQTAANNPTLSTVGNFNAVSGQNYQVSSLFQVTGGAAATSYNVAVEGGGQLLLNGQPVGTQTNFTPDEFDELSFVGGDSTGKIVVAAASASGSSNAVEITASPSATTSANALVATLGSDPYSLVAFTANLENESAGSNAPTLTTIGNFSGNATDSYAVRSLFSATPASGQTITGYQVAVRGAGQLLLNNVPTTQTSFTPDQFDELSFAAGTGSSDILVSAQSGSYSSQAVQITNSNGARSINAAPALYQLDNFSLIGFTAALQQTSSQNTPTLTSIGNFDAVSGTSYRVGNLFNATASSGQSITSYSVAVSGGGTLYLNGVAIDPTTQTSFTPDQFEQLSFTAGASDSDLVVAAKSGTSSSQAVQIHATTAGTTSLNAGAAAAIYDGGDPFLFLAFTASLTSGLSPSAQPQIAATGSLTDPAASIDSAQDSIGLSESSGFGNITDKNATSIANLYQGATGGYTLIGTTPVTSPSIVQILAQANSGTGGSEVTTPASNGQRYEVQAYDSAAQLGT